MKDSAEQTKRQHLLRQKVEDDLLRIIVTKHIENNWKEHHGCFDTPQERSPLSSSLAKGSLTWIEETSVDIRGR
jgi:hypothetical protein